MGTSTGPGIRVAVFVAGVTLVAVGCSGNHDDKSAPGPTTSGPATAPTAAPATPGGTPAASSSPGPLANVTPATRAGESNELMKKTTFHATGTTTVMPGATMETWYDPTQGLRSAVTSNGALAGETVCKDGLSGISKSLLPGGSPQDVHTYSIVKQTSCDTLFTIPTTAVLPDFTDRRTINGTPAVAVKATNGRETSVFWIADTDHPYLLRLESTRQDGRASYTDYGQFTQPVTIPPLPESVR